MGGLSTLTDEVAQILSSVEGGLYLGIRDLAESVAEKLSASKAEEISFNSLNILSEKAANQLIKFTGELSIFGF